jgi:hypothetical protein
VTLFRRRVGLLEALRRPATDGYAPICMTCGRYLDSYEIVEDSGDVVRVLGRHHGDEELASFDLGTRSHATWDDRVEDLARSMRGHGWFDPALVPK